VYSLVKHLGLGIPLV